MSTRPAWWPSGFTPEQLGADVMHKDYETALYTVLAAGCECILRQVNREQFPKPSSKRDYRLQLFVAGNKVVSFEVG